MGAVVSLEQFHGLRDQYVGFCTKCQDWTTEEVEPDAQEYICPVCGDQTVYGAEEAFIEGLVEVE